MPTQATPEFEERLLAGEVPIHVESKREPPAMTVEAIDAEAEKTAKLLAAAVGE